MGGFSGNLLLVDQQFTWVLRQFTSGGSAILLASPAIYFWWISNSLGFSGNLLLVDQQFSWLLLQFTSGGSAILLASPTILILVDQQFSWLLRQFTSGGSAILWAFPVIYFWWISTPMGFSGNLLLVDQHSCGLLRCSTLLYSALLCSTLLYSALFCS